MNSIRIKICGITSLADAKTAVEAGADAIGFVFYAGSPRAVTIDQAAEIAQKIGPFTTLVGLFVDAEPDFVKDAFIKVGLHVAQFHGDETREYCESFQRPYMKAIRMRPSLDVHTAIAAYPSASAVLLDAYRPGVPGGTGETFDWHRVPQSSSCPIVLAGGLTPHNVASAINTTNIYAVDVSGGVEAAPGKKDKQKVITFIQNARQASSLTGNN